MGRAVGLDIGSRAIKVVELSGSPKAFKVQRVLIRPVPEPPAAPPQGELAADPDEALSEAIAEIFATLKLPKDDVCASFSSGVTVLREIQVPFLEDDQIRKVVRFEAENHLHSHSIDDVVVNWVKTGESRDGSRLTIFASPKGDLTHLLAVLRKAGVEPGSVDLDSTAVFTACDAAGVFKDHPNVIVIDVGARSTSLTLVAAGRPVVLRSFLLGTEALETGVTKELQVSLDEGRRRARLPAGPRGDDLYATAASLSPPAADTEKSLDQLEAEVAGEFRQEFVRKLHREAMRSLASLQAESAPERLLLTGGGSLLPGLAQALEQRFELPTQALDLADWVDWKDHGSDPEFTRAAAPTAVGCALRMLGHDPLGIELLKDEFAPTNRFDVLKGALATFVTLLFAVLLGLAFMASEKKEAERQRYTHVAKAAGSLLQTAEIRYRTKVLNETEDEARAKMRAWLNAAPQDQTRVDAYRSLLVRRCKDLQDQLGFGDIPQIQSALKVWLEIFRALNKIPRTEYGNWFRILKMEIKQTSALIRVEVDDQTAFDKIRQQIEQSAYFRERARNVTRVVEPGAAQFQKGHWQQDYDIRFKEED